MPLFLKNTIQCVNSSFVFIDTDGFKTILREDKLKCFKFMPHDSIDGIVEIRTNDDDVFYVKMTEEEFMKVCAFGTPFEKEYGKPKEA